MPLDLTDAELATAATACRAMAYQEGERAKKLENPLVRGPLEANSKRFAVLAEKFESARGHLHALAAYVASNDSSPGELSDAALHKTRTVTRGWPV